MKQLAKISSWFKQPNKSQFYSVSRREYYSKIVCPKDIEEMISRYKNFEKEVVYTDTDIKFNSTELGTSLNNFLEKNSTPRYEIKNVYLEIISHSILFYKERIGKHKAFSQYHFINGSLFWGMYLFNNKLDNNDIIEIEKILKEKYGIPDAITLKNALLMDSNKNKIEFNNEIFTTIDYICGNEKMMEDLIKMIRGYKKLVRVETNEENKNLFDKL